MKNSNLYMLDTNTVSYIIKGSSDQVKKNLVSVPIANLCISAITEAELLRGVAKNPEAKKLPKLVNEFLIRVNIFPWDSSAARAYAKFRTECEKCGKSLGAMDMLIASHAISEGAVLVTNDKAFYYLGHLLELEDWV